MEPSKFYLTLGLVLAALSVFATLGLADTIITKEDTKIEGTIVNGLPEVITIETTGGTLQIKSENLRGLERVSQDIITTQDGSVYKGTITTELPANLKIEVKTGVMEISWDKIKRIHIGEPTEDTGERAPGQAVTLIGVVETKEGSQEQGTIYGFPDAIQIETSAGTLNLKKETITELVLGEPDTIRTQDESLFRGTIVTQLPVTLQLEKEAGVLSIKTANIKRITFTEKVFQGPEPQTKLPSRASPWNWEAFAVEAGVGTLGAAGGGIAGALIGIALGCGTGDIEFCGIGLLIGIGAGVVGGSTLSVQFIGSTFYNTKGNMTMATLFSIGGWAVLGQLPLPASGYIGAGVGAAVGYNLGGSSQPEQAKLSASVTLLEW